MTATLFGENRESNIGQPTIVDEHPVMLPRGMAQIKGCLKIAELYFYH
jgi:hypothetical protein